MRRFTRSGGGRASVSLAVGVAAALLVVACAGIAHAAPAVTCATCTLNCPRPAMFWARELGEGDLGGTRIARGQIDAVAAWIADHAAPTVWERALPAMGAMGDPAWGATPRDRADLQYATLLANLAAGVLIVQTSTGEPVALDPATVTEWEGRSVTLEALVAEVGGRLARPAGDPLDDGTLDRIASGLERINGGAGIGPTCESPGSAVDPGARGVEPGRAFPNPFNVSTSLAYTVPAAGAYVEIGVYDVTGRIVRMLADGPASAGRYAIEWDGTTRHGALARPGAYFIRGKVGGQRIASRVMYVQ